MPPLFPVIIEVAHINHYQKRTIIVLTSSITYLISYNQYLLRVIFQLLLFIARYIPLKQWFSKGSHSPEYQKFKVDKLAMSISMAKQLSQ